MGDFDNLTKMLYARKLKKDASVDYNPEGLSNVKDKAQAVQDSFNDKEMTQDPTPNVPRPEAPRRPASVPKPQMKEMQPNMPVMKDKAQQMQDSFNDTEDKSQNRFKNLMNMFKK